MFMENLAHVKAPALATRASAVLVLIAVLAGCGSTLKSSSNARASASVESASVESATGTPESCAQTVLQTLSTIVARVYHEGLQSERTLVAERLISSSSALREAVEADNPTAARAAGEALLATKHMTNLLVVRGTHTLVDLGGPALAPLHGTLKSAGSSPLATYTTSVWADSGFVSETRGVAEGLIALRANGRGVGGSLKLPAGALPDSGTLTYQDVPYQYTSLSATSYPTGAPLRIYLLKPVSSTAALCGQTNQDTLVNTLKRVANLIYAAEGGPRTLVQIHRIQDYTPLLEAVAQRNPTATTAAIHILLHEHVVRMRVIAGGKLLADVGGPWVLAPVQAKLTFEGHKIGRLVLSIQDDEGYLRLTDRLAGLDVLMYMHEPGALAPTLVKDSLGPMPGPALAAVPASGSYTYRGHDFRVFTVNAKAFPSGPLTIRVLVPIPYS
jgi:hypothetical protein